MVKGLAAIEDDLWTEMVNRRVGILYRLMTLYAPGGESEKTLTLNKLQNPTRCTDAQFAAEELRAWERWKNRAQAPSPVWKGVASSPSGGTGLTPNPKAKSRTRKVKTQMISSQKLRPRACSSARGTQVPSSSNIG